MADDSYEIFQMTIHNKIKFPREFDSAAKSLIKKLTKHDLSERYGNLVKGVDDIKSHRFFKNIDWSALIEKRVKPSYIPLAKELKKQKAVAYKYLPESADNKTFPPIKDAKDPFLNWF